MKDIFEILKQLMPLWLTLIVMGFGFLIYLYYKVSKQNNDLAEKQAAYLRERLDAFDKFTDMYEKSYNHQGKEIARLYGLNGKLEEALEMEKKIELNKLDQQLKEISQTIQDVKNLQIEKPEFDALKEEILKAKHFTEIKYNTLIQNINIHEEPEDDTKKPQKAFLILPHFDDSDAKFKLIKSICDANNLYLLRTEGIIMTGQSISEKVKSMIRQSDIVIADVTGNSPNAMYELGFAHGLNKPVILLASKINEFKIDISNYRMILYNNVEGIQSKLSTGIKETIDEAEKIKDLKRLNRLNKSLQNETTIQDFIELSKKVMSA